MRGQAIEIATGVAGQAGVVRSDRPGHVRDDALVPAPLESARFGLNVYRARVERIDSALLGAAVIDGRCDVAIVRVPSGRGTRMYDLCQWGWPVIQADTLVTYAWAAVSPAPALRAGTVATLGRAGSADVADLRALVQAAFEGYSNHYAANPLFDAAGILAGYQEWAESQIGSEDSDLWLARQDGRAVGFLACRHDIDANASDIVLNGVAPDCGGQGIYTDLVRMAQAEVYQRGIGTLRVATQVGNLRVQGVWSRLGFRLVESLDTFHVNALLCAGEWFVDEALPAGLDRDEAVRHVHRLMARSLAPQAEGFRAAWLRPLPVGPGLRVRISLLPPAVRAVCHGTAVLEDAAGRPVLIARMEAV